MPRLENRLVMRSAIAVALMAAALPRPAAAFSYVNDFETNSNGFSLISSNSLSANNYIPPGYTLPVTFLNNNGINGFQVPTAQSSRFLGFNDGPAQNQQFGFSGATRIRLGLTGLTVGATYQISFDLFIGGSVEGNALPPVYKPDRWRFIADNSALIDTTFNNYGPEDRTGGLPIPFANSGQSYADNDLTGYNNGNPTFHSPFSGAEVVYEPSNSTVPERNYSLYKFGLGRGNGSPPLSFTATSTNATLDWASDFSLNNIRNEFWALDNVIVAELPEPGTFGMMALGLIPLGIGLYRTRRK